MRMIGELSLGGVSVKHWRTLSRFAEQKSPRRSLPVALISPCLFLILLLAVPARAAVAVPVVGQPSPFYGAAGRAVKAMATVEPAEIVIDDSLVFTLTIQGLLNPADVKRPDLSAIEEFRRDFEVSDDATPVSEPAETRVFRYRLRPYKTTVQAVPSVSFPYFDPDRPQPPDQPSFPFRKVRTAAMPIRVRSSAEPAARLPVPLEVPAFAETLANDAGRGLPDWVWWVGAFAPPLAAMMGGIVGRVRYPNAHQRAGRRRSRAARIALTSLTRLGGHSADPAHIVGIVARYLAERFDLPGVSCTPEDATRHLAQTGASPEAIADAGDFFRTADAVRFSPDAIVSAGSLRAAAERLIRRNEGEE